MSPAEARRGFFFLGIDSRPARNNAVRAMKTRYEAAKWAAEKARQDLVSAMLSIRPLVPRENVVDFRGETISTECTAWVKLYYSPNAKNLVAFRRECPEAAAKISDAIEALLRSTEALNESRKVYKAADQYTWDKWMAILSGSLESANI